MVIGEEDGTAVPVEQNDRHGGFWPMADHPAVPARVRLLRYTGRVGGRPSTWSALPLMTHTSACNSAPERTARAATF